MTDARTTLAHRDPLLAELDAMAAEMDRAFGRRPANAGARGWLPPVDVWETEDEVVIELDVPGCTEEGLSAEVVNGQLVVTGERQASEGAVRRYRSERWQGRFVRSFTVPAGTDADSIDASYTEGVLTLKLKKPDTVRPKRIEIGRRDLVHAGS